MQVIKHLSITATFAVLIALCSTPVLRAIPSPLHSYNFNGSLNDSGPNNVSITSEGGTIGASQYAFDPQLPPGDFNQGLTLQNATLPDFGIYTIEMYLKYESVTDISGDYWLKLIDYKNGAESLGVYYVDAAFPLGNPPGVSSVIRHAYGPFPGRPLFVDSPAPVMTGGEWVHFATSRNAAGTVTGYIDGAQVYSFDDSIEEDAIFGGTKNPNHIMRFLQGDTPATSDGYYEVGEGAIDFLNIYNVALPAADIAALAAAVVPEPSSAILLGCASLLLFKRRCI